MDPEEAKMAEAMKVMAKFIAAQSEHERVKAEWEAMRLRVVALGEQAAKAWDELLDTLGIELDRR